MIGNRQHVMVAGAGLGGLCLAQGLREADVEVTVFERDPSPASRAQGYRIGLKEAGVRALRACLPPHLFDLAVATSIGQATRMIFMDARLTPKFAKPIPPLEPGVAALGVNRLTLREILLSGLDRVRFGQAVEDYEPLGGGVRAHLPARAADGALLVGADGTGSAVRRRLLPHAVIEELDRAVYGRTPLTGELLAATPGELVDTFNRLIGDDGTAVSIATCRPLTPVRDAVAEHAPGVPLTDVPPFFSWTLTVPGAIPYETSPRELHALALRTVDGWHPAVRRIIAEAEPEATFPVSITSAHRVPPWDEPAVTLLGDAVHTMSPGRGDGANVALRDAHLLAELLTGAAARGEPLTAAKQAYEREMLDDAFAAVEAGRRRPFAPMTPR